MRPVILALPGNDALADALAADVGERLPLTVRSFPDGETYVRLDGPVEGREVILACTLDRPDAKTLPLLFVAAAAQQLGATRVGLVAPYLAYMRQDTRFRPGEGITSAYFAALLSRSIDWLATVDPHLHRHRSLAELYTVPAVTGHAAPLLAAWIRAHVERPILIGPDSESAQWVSAAADLAGAPSLVLTKVRRDDREVEVSVPRVGHGQDRTPVLLDDIISTGRTMLAAVGQLVRRGTAPPVCIGVHAVFADRAYEELRAAGARVVTCNTIPHPSNAIDVGPVVAQLVRGVLQRGDP